jgi:tetratricopeptide (TPR) repeat protein
VREVLPYLRRWICLFAFSFCAVYLAMHFTQRTSWYQERLYWQLLRGDPREQLRAAAALARLGAEEKLLASLKADSPTAREHGQRALEFIWFNAAGPEAYELTQAANRAAEKKEHQRALEMLNRLTEKYPRFAEGWNQRASVHWQLGEIEQSMADSERALALNTHHYGALQGLGLCHLQRGDVAEACRCLRAALQLIPYDQATRNSLRRCEELLRSHPPPSKRGRAADVI